MDPIAGSRFVVEAVEWIPVRRRRPVRSPVSPTQLASRAWSAVRPYTPLAVLALVFGLSVGVVQIVERAPLPQHPPAAVSSPAPELR